MRLDDGMVEGTQGAQRKRPSEGISGGASVQREAPKGGTRGGASSESAPKARGEQRRLQDFLSAFV
ncbi:hypothetical protein [Stigmatella aurantiaca]|uniref:Uncharacterized protein n=1 Tax=Stigmatella aurantiaca (strain DW4/3-1) TaxID=378806 RepID=E3FRS0_STIAD|nr:hypothetical protein [Stigmatella aurantiaca]ADO68255.1 uncharacterized protein STAUR_0446 [Stigmatella aurantiaca DW4/3-1]